MKNNFLNILGTVTLVLFISSSITSCSVEDGIDGTNGIDGIDGQDGADGQDGTDGIDGADGMDAIGLEEFANYGSITLKMQGIRTDSVAFDQETELEFISPEFDQNNYRDEDPDLDFYFLRLIDAPNTNEVNGVGIELYVTDNGLSSQAFDLNIEFLELAIFSNDLKYFTLSNYISGTPLTNSNDNNNSSDKLVDTNNNNSPNTFTISDYSFDDSTNTLKFSFTMDVPASNNQTGHDLSIEGNVDIVVFENIGSNG